MDAILLEEIPEKYTVDSCQKKTFTCTVWNRGGWYDFRTTALTEEIDIYNFNPQYSTPIYIGLPTENDDEKIYISGLYHWGLQLLSLDFPDGRHLMVNSPEREPFNEKDILVMERYLQEMNSDNDDEDKSDRDIQEMESENNNELKAKIQNGMTLRLRTRDSLTELLQAGKSGDWLIAKWREKKIAKVQIFNWDGSLMIQASFDASKSQRTEKDRLIVGLSSEDARIVQCDPPLKWVGQNPVNYVDDGAVEKQENEPEATAPQVTDEPPPNAPPDGWDDFSPQLAEICESVYGEPVRLIYWRVDGGGKQFSTLFRERRRGWYFQMLLTKENGKWSSEHRVPPSFLLLLKPDETAWAKLTKEATTEDWYALDEIFLDTLAFPGSEVLLAGSDLIGEEVVDEAMERFGFYVPDEELLPALIFENRRLGMKLVSYFKHPDGFAKENMVMDDKAEQCRVFGSLKEAQQRLAQKLSYYTDEFKVNKGK